MSERPFDLARRVSVAELSGVALRKLGRDLFGPCPLCGGDKESQRFHVTPAANAWHCFGCGEGGGAVELAYAMKHGRTAKGAPFDELLATARELASGGRTLPPAPPSREAEKDKPASPPSKQWLRLWTEAKPAARTLVESWLGARGLDVALHGQALARLRFHPNALAAAGKDERGKWWRVHAPAMVGALVDKVGFVCGVHCTYLAGDGLSKAALAMPEGELVAARKMWGAGAGVCSPLSDLRAASPEQEAGPLVVGEGFETVLSFIEPWLRDGKPVRAAATLTLGNLQGGYVRDANGRATRPPLADLSRPPWLLKEPGHVLALIDRDMSPLKLRRHAHFGADEMAEMDTQERAWFCAALTTQHWRAAGALSVTPVQPRTLGDDFNDALKRRPLDTTPT